MKFRNVLILGLVFLVALALTEAKGHGQGKGDGKGKGKDKDGSMYKYQRELDGETFWENIKVDDKAVTLMTFDVKDESVAPMKKGKDKKKPKKGPKPNSVVMYRFADDGSGNEVYPIRLPPPEKVKAMKKKKGKKGKKAGEGYCLVRSTSLTRNEINSTVAGRQQDWDTSVEDGSPVPFSGAVDTVYLRAKSDTANCDDVAFPADVTCPGPLEVDVVAADTVVADDESTIDVYTYTGKSVLIYKKASTGKCKGRKAPKP